MSDDHTPDHDEMINEGKRVALALAACEERAAALKDERTTAMSKMADAGISWAEIARTFKVTPQAAMYATGHAVRQPRSKKPKKSPGDASAATSKEDADSI